MNFEGSVQQSPLWGGLLEIHCFNPMTKKSARDTEHHKTKPAEPPKAPSAGSGAPGHVPPAKPKAALGSSLTFALRKMKQNPPK